MNGEERMKMDWGGVRKEWRGEGEEADRYLQNMILW